MHQRNNFMLLNVFENCKRPLNIVYRSFAKLWFGGLTIPTNEWRNTSQPGLAKPTLRTMEKKERK